MMHGRVTVASSGSDSRARTINTDMLPVAMLGLIKHLGHSPNLATKNRPTGSQ